MPERPPCAYCGERTHGSRFCPRVERASPQAMDAAGHVEADRDREQRLQPLLEQRRPR